MSDSDPTLEKFKLVSERATPLRMVTHEHVEKQTKIWEQLKEGCALKLRSITPMGAQVGQPFWVLNFSWGHMPRIPREVPGPSSSFTSYDLSDRKKRNVGRLVGSYVILAYTGVWPSGKRAGKAAASVALQLEKDSTAADPV